MLDGSKAVAAGKLNAPAVFDPIDALLAIDREYALRSAFLGEEAVEAIEGTDVQDGEILERGGDRGQPVTVIPCFAWRVETVGGIQGEGVEPEWYGCNGTLGLKRTRVDRYLVGELALRRPTSVAQPHPGIVIASPARLVHQ